MKAYYTTEVIKFVEKLNYRDRTRLERTRKLFEDYGFQIGRKYIKKISASGIWELRTGNIRLFLCLKHNKAIGVHIIHKKTQKLPIKDVKLAERRSNDL